MDRSEFQASFAETFSSLVALSSNPFVMSDPKIRFYAGAPFTSSDGQALGTLCVVDTVPRQLSPHQGNALLALSRQVQAQFELRKHLIELRSALARHSGDLNFKGHCSQ